MRYLFKQISLLAVTCLSTLSIATGRILLLAPAIAQIPNPVFRSPKVDKLTDISSINDAFSSNLISSGAMLPTLESGDYVLVDKLIYRSNPPSRGDIVLFNATRQQEEKNLKGSFVMRIIGLPGETIEIKNKKTYIDKKLINEKYISEPPEYDWGPAKVPTNSYLVLGDNRNNTYDSHYWGFLPRGLIVGQAVRVYWPLGRKRELSQKREQKRAILENLFITNAIADKYREQGQYNLSIEYAQQAMATSREIANPSFEGATLSNLAITYITLGQYDKALKYLEQALDAISKSDDLKERAKILNNFAAAHYSLQRYSKALEYLQQSLTIRERNKDVIGTAFSLANISVIYQKQGQYKRALEYSKRALAVKQRTTPVFEGAILNNIGSIYVEQGDYNRGIEYLQKALSLRKQMGRQQGIANTLANIGFAYSMLGKASEAEASLLEAIQIQESLRPGLTDENQISVFETQKDAYQILEVVFVAQGKTEAALEISERGRARAFVQLLTSRFTASPGKQLQAPSPSIEEIRLIAKQHNATLVQYSIPSPDLLNIWVIKPTGEIAIQTISLTTSLGEEVIASRETIGVRGRGSSIEIEPIANALLQVRQTQQLQKLYDLLIKPITSQLPVDPNAVIIFVPQGVLFQIPFSALRDGEGKYLIEKHTVLTSPSIQVLQLTHKQRQRLTPQLGQALVIGNPIMPKVTVNSGDQAEQLSNLPGTEQEAIAISKILNVQAITGSKATKAFILPKLSQAGIVHLATHGLLDDFKGLGVPGAIALAPSGTGEINDGLLTANEIFDLKLNAELIVLSACDTGRGRITGDGVIGLSRSLITAGVPSVIVSLWSVPDAPTAELMVEFYRNWKKRKLDKAEALRQAMLATMKTHPNPRDWAAFTLIGEAE